jgi:glucose/arabinose dehydrogenase
MSKRLSILLSLAVPFAASAQGYGDSVRLTEVATGLTQPLALRHAGDGSGRRFIVQQNGVIRWMDGAGTLLPDPFFTMANVSTCSVAGISAAALGFSGSSGERGLLGLAFHPDFGVDNDHFFVNYTDTRGDTVVARFTANGNTTDYASCRIVLRVDQDFANHNGGDIHFGPDGYLYIGMGDGGSGNDPCNRAQTLSPSALATNDGNNASCPADANFTALASGNPDSRALLGKMLRIDVDGETTAANAAGLCGKRSGGGGSDVVAFYAIPNPMGGVVNPFAGGDPASGCDEVWAYGLRNPWRFSFDRTTGDLLIGDVGQNTTEEIDFEPAGDTGGRNYGWDVCEGPFQSGSRSIDCPTAGATDPIIEYARSSPRCSLTGGYRYRGPVSNFVGTYVFADYCSGEILLARETTPQNWQRQVWLDTTQNIVGFGEDEAGRIYVANSPISGGATGTVSRIDEAPMFSDGFED